MREQHPAGGRQAGAQDGARVGLGDVEIAQVRPADSGLDRIIFVPYRYEHEQVEAIARDVIPKLKAG